MDKNATALQTYLAANTILAPMLEGLQLISLLRGLLPTGLLNAARAPSTVTQLAETTGLDSSYVTSVCYVLDSHGVFLKQHDTYCLTEQWATLTDPDAVLLLSHVIDYALARAYLFQNPTLDYWTLQPEQRVALAVGASLNPMSSHSPEMISQMLGCIPDLAPILASECRYLELGCGACGGLLSMLQAYSQVTAVGIDIAKDVLDEARRRALLLGLNDRITLWEGDARNFNVESEFDFAWWSQFFFTASGRAATLRVAWQALKPGGLLITPVSSGDVMLQDEFIHTAGGRAYTLSRLLYSTWGVPIYAAEELHQEITAAGFADLQTIPTPRSTLVVARRPFS